MDNESDKKLLEANKRLALCDDLLDALGDEGTYLSDAACEIIEILRPSRTLQVK